MEIIKGLLYSKDHEWVKVEDNKAYIGITDFAQNALGDVVYVELPEIGDSFSKKDVLGVVESVKAASEIYIPISGEVVEVNDELSENPELINQQPYDSWIAIFELQNTDELDDLMDYEEYKKFCEEN